MSQILDRLRRRRHIAIFPLPLVLLPNETIPLHIFEERYRQMLRDIESEENLFGISFVDVERSASERPAVGSVGCIAEITESELLPDGRSNTTAVGLARYRINEFVESGDPYLVADVEFFEDDPELDTDALRSVSDEVFEIFERMVKAADRLSGERGLLPELRRTEPEHFSFLVAAAVNFENEKKYELLRSTSTLERLTDLRTILKLAVAQLEENADIQTVARKNGHSKKKIDI